MKLTPGVNLTTILRATFSFEIVMGSYSLSLYFFANDNWQKDAHKILVKWSSVINFTNILRAACLLIDMCLKNY